MNNLPAGPFDIIVADPPWRSEFGKTCSRAVERHYETLKVDTLADLPVSTVASPASLLFLWVTAPMLRHGLELMERWGWQYRTNGVWCKDKPGTGKWLRGSHEIFLLGRRGKFPAPKPGTLPVGVLHAPRRRHSEKPEELQDAIETTYPGHRYLELFARRERSGWTVWGDEVSVTYP